MIAHPSSALLRLGVALGGRFVARRVSGGYVDAPADTQSQGDGTSAWRMGKQAKGKPITTGLYRSQRVRGVSAAGGAKRNPWNPMDRFLFSFCPGWATEIGRFLHPLRGGSGNYPFFPRIPLRPSCDGLPLHPRLQSAVPLGRTAAGIVPPGGWTNVSSLWDLVFPAALDPAAHAGGLQIFRPLGTNGNGGERQTDGAGIGGGDGQDGLAMFCCWETKEQTCSRGRAMSMASGHVLQPEGKKLDVLTWPAP
jgi:hypothetical protein